MSHFVIVQIFMLILASEAWIQRGKNEGGIDSLLVDFDEEDLRQGFLTLYGHHMGVILGMCGGSGHQTGS